MRVLRILLTLLYSNYDDDNNKQQHNIIHHNNLQYHIKNIERGWC